MPRWKIFELGDASSGGGGSTCKYQWFKTDWNMCAEGVYWNNGCRKIEELENRDGKDSSYYFKFNLSFSYFLLDMFRLGKVRLV